jgi:DMSO/TMAO reductase YedYZ molybdopterin-dependent catalytic subunit
MTADGTPRASRSVAAECLSAWKFTLRMPASWHWRRRSRRRFDGDSGVPVSDDQTRPRSSPTRASRRSTAPPNDDFFRIDTAFRPPRIDDDTHVVGITGLVEQPSTLSYAQLLEMADTEADVTLTCVSNEVGGDLIGNARWHGVPLERVLDRTGVQVGATQVVGRAVDGWTAGFPLEVLDGRSALIAVGMNGEPLPVHHGFPVRLVIAGLASTTWRQWRLRWDAEPGEQSSSASSACSQARSSTDTSTRSMPRSPAQATPATATGAVARLVPHHRWPHR